MKWWLVGIAVWAVLISFLLMLANISKRREERQRLYSPNTWKWLESDGWE